MVERGTSGRLGVERPVATGPTTLTPLAARSNTETATIPATSATNAPGIRFETSLSPRIRMSAPTPTARVYGFVSGRFSTSWPSCSITEPVPAGTPKSLGNWPTMIVIANPKMNPVTTDLVRKSEMKPSRATPAAMRITPTVNARAAESAR